MKNYFTFRESSNIGWTICPNYSEFIPESNGQWVNPVKGSCALIAARISGLSWPQWLRYCRSNGASLYGKGNKYVVPIWKEPNKDFLNKLNQRATELSKLINFKELNW